MSTIHDLANSETELLTRWEERVESLIRAKGGTVYAREFQEIVNVTYHDVESEVYDAAHREMWDSLQPVFALLSCDIERACAQGSGWTLTDVGCGTGLATDQLLQTTLKDRIRQLVLIDTSAKMIERCKQRAANWRVPASFICGQIDALPEASTDLLVVCSVLHHIPDLTGFCQQLTRVVRPGGAFVHIHDQCRDAARNPRLQERRTRYDAWRRKSVGRRILRAIKVRAARLLKPYYLDEVNRRLIAAGVVKKPLSPQEIWSITDLRVGGLPITASDGISVDELQTALEGFELLSTRTYGFFGLLACHLPPPLRAEEQRLLEASSEDGAFLSAVWVRK